MLSMMDQPSAYQAVCSHAGSLWRFARELSCQNTSKLQSNTHQDDIEAVAYEVLDDPQKPVHSTP